MCQKDAFPLEEMLFTIKGWALDGMNGDPVSPGGNGANEPLRGWIIKVLGGKKKTKQKGAHLAS